MEALSMKRVLPKYKDGYKYSWDSDNRSWNRYTDDPYAEMFNNIVITPKNNRERFNYEKQPSPLRTPNTESDQAYTQRRIEETTKNSTPIADAINLGVGFIPGVGNAKMGMDAINAAIRNDYNTAAALALGTIMPGTVKILKPVSKKLFELYNRSAATRALLPTLLPAAALSYPGIKDAVTGENLKENLIGLGEMIGGSTIGVIGGMKFANKLEPLALKRLYGINRNGNVPKFTANSIRNDALFTDDDWGLWERNKATRSLVRHNFDQLKSGDSYAIVDDGFLSKDSAPLYLAELARHSNVGKINTVKDALGNTTMMRLNKYGYNHNISDINRMISVLRQKGVDLPDAKQIGN